MAGWGIGIAGGHWGSLLPRAEPFLLEGGLIPSLVFLSRQQEMLSSAAQMRNGRLHLPWSTRRR